MHPVIINGLLLPCLERHESVMNDINGSVTTSSERANAINKLQKSKARELREASTVG